ncbi:hypothetical protein ATR1_193d0001, partial [Acetobacter tropicalis]
HPPLHAACPATGISSHPPLWPTGQFQPQGQPRPGAGTAECHV